MDEKKQIEEMAEVIEGYTERGVYSAKDRATTFRGIAAAMAEQWGGQA